MKKHAPNLIKWLSDKWHCAPAWTWLDVTGQPDEQEPIPEQHVWSCWRQAANVNVTRVLCLNCASLISKLISRLVNENNLYLQPWLIKSSSYQPAATCSAASRDHEPLVNITCCSHFSLSPAHRTSDFKLLNYLRKVFYFQLTLNH